MDVGSQVNALLSALDVEMNVNPKEEDEMDGGVLRPFVRSSVRLSKVVGLGLESGAGGGQASIHFQNSFSCMDVCVCESAPMYMCILGLLRLPLLRRRLR